MCMRAAMSCVQPRALGASAVCVCACASALVHWGNVGLDSKWYGELYGVGRSALTWGYKRVLCILVRIIQHGIPLRIVICTG